VTDQTGRAGEQIAKAGSVVPVFQSGNHLHDCVFGLPVPVRDVRQGIAQAAQRMIHGRCRWHSAVFQSFHHWMEWLGPPGRFARPRRMAPTDLQGLFPQRTYGIQHDQFSISSLQAA